MKISFIGGGNMAKAILSGLQQNGFAMQDIVVIEPSHEKNTLLSEQFKVATAANIVSVEDWNNIDVIVLCVKPQQLKSVCEALAPNVSGQLVISIAAGIRAINISQWLNDHQTIIRVMPNTPAQIQAGISGMYALPSVTNAQRDTANRIMASVGSTLWLDNEQQMDALTAISGSGPAYVFYMIEALQQAAEKLGFNQDQASQLALQTFAGASALAIQSAETVSTLRAQVTSKGGTTEQGIASLESDQLTDIIYRAAKAAAEKSVILGDALSK